MANSNAFSAVPDLSLKERLFVAMVTGPLEQGEELLDCLEEVDSRLVNQRTLLHVGVDLGKVDWVEELLARGTDPNLVDDNHSTALYSAEEMLRKSPVDMNRRQVRRLVRMVNRRDQAMRFRLQTSAARGAASSTPPVFLSDHMSALATFISSASALKDEMRTQTAELRSSLEELKERLCGRDELFRCLEDAVTSSAELLTSLSGRVQGGNTLSAMGSVSGTPLPLSNMADERRECVDGMMRRTVILYGWEEGVRLVRKLYERLYDEDDATACLLTFLHRESQFVVKVDCDSKTIRRMKERYVNFDGEEKSGSTWTSFAEFSTNTVYFGAKVEGFRSEESAAGLFARTLAQMSLHICFKNGGKPYEGDDNMRETEWKRAFKEVEEKRKRGNELHLWIRWAFNWKTQAARESYLAACVPLIIAEYGSNEGTRMLQEQSPLLLRYFKEHVVATLLSKARE